VYKKDNTGAVRYVGEKLTVSSNDTTPDYLYNKITEGTGITKTELNDGLNETLKLQVNNTVGSSRLNVVCGKTGNASTNTYLEFFRAISSYDSPWVVSEDGEIKSLSVSCKTATTVTIQVFVNGTAAESITLTAAKVGTVNDLSYLVYEEDEVSVQVTSGSASDVIFFISVLVYL
jgi:hypothetical protein